MATSASREDGAALARAVNAVDDLQAELQDLEDQHLAVVRRRDPNASNVGIGPEGFLTDPETLHQLSQMASSRMPLGRVELGEYLSREAVAAQLGNFAARPFAQTPGETEGTDEMRRGTSRGIVQQLRRPLRILYLIPTATMDGNWIPYVQEDGTLDSARETVEGSTKPATQVEFIDAEAKAETVAHSRLLYR